MNETTLIFVLVALLAVAFSIAVAVASHRRARRRHMQLQEHFGPEYNVAREELGNTNRTDKALAARERRVARLHLKDLGAMERQRFATLWQQVQTHFVDDPAVAVTSANDLVNQLMQARGYPTESYEQRLTDLSVHHPDVLQHYRAAHLLAGAVHNGTIDSEQLRQAIIHYRALFTALLQEGDNYAIPLQHAHAHAR